LNQPMPMPLSDDDRRKRGLMADGLIGRIRLRPELCFRHGVILRPQNPTGPVDMAKAQIEMQQRAAMAAQQLAGFMGNKLLTLAMMNPGVRLVIMPYMVDSVAHDADMGVQVWEFYPGPGQWRSGMLFEQKGPAKDEDAFLSVADGIRSIRDVITVDCEIAHPIGRPKDEDGHCNDCRARFLQMVDALRNAAKENATYPDKDVPGGTQPT